MNALLTLSFVSSHNFGLAEIELWEFPLDSSSDDRSSLWECASDPLSVGSSVDGAVSALLLESSGDNGLLVPANSLGELALVEGSASLITLLGSLDDFSTFHGS